MKTVRVKMPYNRPDKTLKLCDKIIEKDTLLGAASPLTGLLDMVVFGKTEQCDVKGVFRRYAGLRLDFYPIYFLRD